MSENQHAVWGFVIEEARKWATRGLFAVVAAALVMLFTPWKERIKDIWNSPEQLDTILSTLNELNTEVKRAAGEDRPIFELPGMTYVKEPVFQGDQITLNMVVRSTHFGSRCTLLRRTPLFTDETNIATPGAAQPAERQFSMVDTPLRIVLTVPPQVQPGRVTVHLSREFDCNGNKVFDTSRPTAFMLLNRPEVPKNE